MSQMCTNNVKIYLKMVKNIKVFSTACIKIVITYCKITSVAEIQLCFQKHFPVSPVVVYITMDEYRVFNLCKHFNLLFS